LEELQEQFQKWDCPTYRVTQLLDWLYRRKATSWDAMTNLPKNLRDYLDHTFSLEILQLARKQGSHDTTQKFLWRLSDGAFIESVLIPANPALYGEASDRHTLCVSTQVGCAYGCRFCASGLEGWKRNLGAHEIVEQVLADERWHSTQSPEEKPPDRLVNNLVIMGMGEPLANYDNVMAAAELLSCCYGGMIRADAMTISTVGVVPEIHRFVDERRRFRLSISLGAAIDEKRARLVPVAARWPVKDLMEAARRYAHAYGHRVNLAYVCLADENMGEEDALALKEIIGDTPVRLDLIEVTDLTGAHRRPTLEELNAFRRRLKELLQQPVVRRYSGGADIAAACGTLAGARNEA
jgi:23S rRNA (adenine2503-C2)-methyltransferase